jgi:hypothetical protein
MTSQVVDQTMSKAPHGRVAATSSKQGQKTAAARHMQMWIKTRKETTTQHMIRQCFAMKIV